MKALAWRQRLRWVFVALSILALSWTVALLSQAWPGLQANVSQLRKGWLWVSLACMLLWGYLSFESFRLVFLQLKPGLYGRLRLAHLHFAGQLMKHLPGRVWGVAYQATMGGHATLAEWVGANALDMIFSTGFAIWIPLVVLGFVHGYFWGTAVAFVGIIVYFLGWNPRPLGALLGLLRKLPLRVIGRLCDAVQPIVRVESAFKARVLLLLAVNWLIYVSAWASLATAWPGLNASDGVVLCVYYIAAWLAGYLSVATPSGLGVRELVFTLLAYRFSKDVIVAMAIFGRAGMLTVDVVFAAFFGLFRGKDG